MAVGIPLLTIGLFLSVISVCHSKQYNFLNCAAYPPWPVDLDPISLIRDQALIQEYLHAWQHSQRRCDAHGAETFSADFGIGNGFLRSVILMLKAMDGGQIYR